MKIEQQTSAPEYNPEVQVKMTLSELKSIIALVGNSSQTDLSHAVNKANFNDEVKFINRLTQVYNSLEEQYLAIPKKPKFQPIAFTIESEEELIALRVGTGEISGSIISATLYNLGVRRKQDEVDQISNANYAMFGVFDKIFEGQVK
jgi:hypothetical protein